MSRLRVTISVTVCLALLAVAAATVVAGGLPQSAGRVQAAAAWSSGWVSIAQGATVTLTHNMGGDVASYAVELWFMDDGGAGLGINTRAYGGLEADGMFYGAAWQRLTPSTVQVVRSRDDTYADKVLVRIHRPDPPVDYGSPWTAIQPGQALAFTHNLGGDADDLVAGIWFSGTVGINQRALGGMEVAGPQYGAYWDNLDASRILVNRLPDDHFAQQVRVVVNRPDPPAFDSDWVDVAPGESRTITHNLGGDPLSYLVRVEFKDTSVDGRGINHYGAGGIALGTSLEGANWEKLTSSTIDVFRQPQDAAADQVRVRIWVAQAQSHRICLPLALRNR